MKKQTRLFITLGDPLSVNVELVHKLLQGLSSELSKLNTVLVGSFFHWKDQLAALGFPTLDFSKVSDGKSLPPSGLQFLDVGGVEQRASLLTPKERGEIAVRSLFSIRDFLEKDCVVLTCPIDKFAAHEAGFEYPGHTEFFTDISKRETLMLLAGPRLRVGLATNHLALKDVSASLSTELIRSKISILHRALQKHFGIPNPRIGVCGVNPHCGDGGLFGDEEERILKPAIESFHDPKISGPYPADTLFYRAYHGTFDAVLAIYHDQGLGPLKTVHFDEAVNVTCGLPYLRLSPDHGPAKDLFLQNKASLNSMEEALRLSLNYLGGKNS